MLRSPRLPQWSNCLCNTTSLMGEVNYLACLFEDKINMRLHFLPNSYIRGITSYGFPLMFFRYPRDHVSYLAIRRFRHDSCTALHPPSIKGHSPSTRGGMNYSHSHFENSNILPTLLCLACPLLISSPCQKIL